MHLLSLFLTVILPVFGIVVLGYLLGRRLELQARTLTRASYYLFVPAFVFQAIKDSQVPLDSALKMLCFIAATHLLAGAIAGGVGRLLGRSREMVAAYVMVAIFGNVAGFGLAVIRFHLGEDAIPPATIYLVVLNVIGFVISVGAAGWAHGGGKGAVWRVLKTPALWAVVPALVVSTFGIAVPLTLSRMIGLLADAMVPVMLLALGLQLLEQGRVTLSPDVLLASGFRLVLTPAMALILGSQLGLGQTEYLAGVLQSAMPAAILTTIIARENDIAPSFVTSVVVVSTLASLVTLTLLMAFL